MKRVSLTRTQQKVLDFVRWYLKAKGWPPTRREISDHFGWKAHNAAAQHLWLIERKGYLRIVSNTARGIEIL